MSLVQIASSLATVQVELRARRYFVRRTINGREVGLFDHDWHRLTPCPRCFFLKQPESVLCSRCRADVSMFMPGWRGPWDDNL